MAIKLPRVMHVTQNFRRVPSNAAKSSTVSNNVPRRYISVYVGEEQKKRYVVLISYLNEPLFQKLLNKAEEEFGYDHPMGGLTIPCRDNVFMDLTTCLAEYCSRRTFTLFLLKKVGISCNVDPISEGNTLICDCKI